MKTLSYILSILIAILMVCAYQNGDYKFAIAFSYILGVYMTLFLLIIYINDKK